MRYAAVCISLFAALTDGSSSYSAERVALSESEIATCVARVLQSFATIQNPRVSSQSLERDRHQLVIEYSFVDRLGGAHGVRLPIYRNEEGWYVSINDLTESEDEPGYVATRELYRSCGIDGSVFAGLSSSERR